MQNSLVNLGIVLLPPQETWEWLVAVSGELNGQRRNPGVLLGGDQMPHLSLIHSHVLNGKLEELYRELAMIAGRFDPLGLSTEGLYSHRHRDVQFIGVGVSRTDALQGLHVAVADALLPFEVRERTSRQRAYGKFFPHFTLAVNLGEVGHDVAAHTFTADRIAACRLGQPFSTCDEILQEWKLK
ncbi:MAG: 2'-5' RNA ligase family protein [Patescibacteria group bacterium]